MRHCMSHGPSQIWLQQQQAQEVTRKTMKMIMVNHVKILTEIARSGSDDTVVGSDKGETDKGEQR